MSIYLDYAAATPMADEVKVAMEPYLTDIFYNPSSNYLAAQAAKKSLNEARMSVAHWLGAKPAEIIFTAGATESNNLAVHGVIRANPEANVVISAIEHEAVRLPASEYEVRQAQVNIKGIVDLDNLRNIIDDKTALVSIIYANNEIGSIQPLPKISQLIQEVRSDRKARGIDRAIYFHTDAVQAANYLNLHVSKLGVDLLTLSAAKIYGPKQVGCLYIRGGTALEPLISGGGQEMALRSGTENVAGTVGFARALDIAQESKKEEGRRIEALRNKLKEIIITGYENAELAGGGKKRLPNNLNIHFDGLDGERLMMELDEKGVMVSTGAACEAANDEPSHVLLALGLSEDQAESSLRISLGRHTTDEEIQVAGKTIVDVANSISQN